MAMPPALKRQNPPGLLGRWSTSLRHPLALVSLIVGGSLLLSYAVLSPLSLLLIGGILGVGLGAVIGLALAWSAPRSKPFKVDAHAEAITKLRRALSKLVYEEGIEKPAEQAVDQVQLIRDRFQHFETVLASKLSPKELTYERYHSTARAVRDAIMQNLNSILLTLQSLQTMGDASAIDIRNTEQGRLTRLLADNQSALNRLDEATLAIGKIQTERGADPDLDAMLDDLRELAERAEKYSSQ